jgi:hypothetical protein
MDRTWDAESVGEQLGTESVGNVVTKVEAYCAYEERRITLANQPRIIALQQEGSLLLEEESGLMERLRHAPPPGDIRSRKRRAAYYWGIVGILTLAAFFFSVLTFDPFRLGWKGYLYCLGIAVSTPFLLEQVLEKWNAQRLFKALATIACAAALASLVLLAVIRGDLFAEEMKNSASVVTFDDAQPESEPESENNFYDETVVLLRLVTALLAVAMELGAGLALNEAWRIGSSSSEDWGRHRERLCDVRQRMVSISYEIATLQNEAPVFAARFWRNFYRAMLTHSVRSAMTKLLILLLAAFPLGHGRAAAQDHVMLVVAVDLTQSVAAAGPDHEIDFRKNIDAITKLLTQVPAGSRVTVLGITDRSFAQPYILLSARVPDDSGYFGERLKAEQAQLVGAWRRRSTKLTPTFRQTDIVGALLLADEIFDQQKEAKRRILIIFSDMRQDTPDLNFEFLKTATDHNGIGGNKNSKVVMAHLRGVQVHALGVDGAGRSLSYWWRLRSFWAEYFRNTEATLANYTTLRQVSPMLVSRPDADP